MIEIWKDIAGFEGHYQVSNLGQIKSLSRLSPSKHGSLRRLPERIMALKYDKDGYPTVGLHDMGRKWLRVHRLVAAAFLENPESKSQVNHIDGNKQNNAVDNLEWATSHENMRHAVNHLGRRGERMKTSKLKEDQVSEIRKRLHGGERQVDIARDYGVSKCTVHAINHGRTWSHVA